MYLLLPFRCLLPLCLFLLGVQPLAAAEQAARVVFVSGEVDAVDDTGNVRSLSRNDVVREGDRLRVGEGLLQLAFLDGAFLALEHDSELVVEAFVPPERDGGRVHLNQPRGTLRTVTGRIGYERTDAYRLTTPFAVVGIRGTGYRSTLCQDGSCRDAVGEALADGIYLQTSEGATSLTTHLGSQLVRSGEVGFAAGMQSLPKLTDLVPLASKVEQSKESADEVTEQVQEWLASNPEAIARAMEQLNELGLPAAFAEHADELAAYLGLTISVGGTQDYVLVEGSIVTSPSALAIPADAFGSSSGAAYLLTDEVGDAVSFASQEPLRSFAVEGNILFPATHLDRGSDAQTGAHWGRWQGLYSYFDGSGLVVGGDVPGGHHYLYAKVTLPTVLARMSGTLTYTDVIGATTPSASDGSSWSLSGGSVSLYFDTAEVDGHFILVGPTTQQGTLTYTPAYTGGLGADGRFATTLAGSCGPIGCSGEIAGALVGEGAEGVAAAYRVTGSGPTVSGTLLQGAAR